jgi:hypothetical protein
MRRLRPGADCAAYAGYVMTAPLPSEEAGIRTWGVSLDGFATLTNWVQRNGPILYRRLWNWLEILEQG